MKKIIFIALAGFIISSCNNKNNKTMNDAVDNPFYTEYKTPYEVPPFDKIKYEHYKPAFLKGIEEQNENINKIINTVEPASFENTIVALDNSSIILRKVSNVFFNLTESMNTPEMLQIAKDVTPLITKNNDDINLNEKLFARIKSVYEQKDKLNLNTEQLVLLEKTYKGFVRGGADLDNEKKEKLRKLNEEIAMLSLKFGENLLAETNNFKLVIDKKEDLAGLPQSVIDAAAEAAIGQSLNGKWLFTLHKPSLIPFLQYSDKRELREKMYKGYINRANNNNEFDNKKTAQKIIELRVEKAKLFGYNNFAEYVIEENMASKPENVYALLDQLMEKAAVIAKKEADEMQKFINKSGQKFKLEAWDWFYYSEKVRKEKFNLDEESLRPYFQLDNVLVGLFDVVNKLYGLKIIEKKDVPTYHPDVRFFEVKDADDTFIGTFYMDFFPRETKRGGAWMEEFTKQQILNGKDIRPIISTVYNFTKPTADKPALLNFDEVETIFHEFGHALHGLLSKCTYYRLSGTSVARDFVELPSQVLENWGSESSIIKTYAKHYQTGVPIPDDLLKKIDESSHFGQGFATVEYLAASYLDMDLHSISDITNFDIAKFESNSMARIKLISEIAPRYRTTYFSHIFEGGYSAGYYVYIWAEILDADAYEAFKETGNVFDEKTAKAFRTNILEKGGSDDPMKLYKQFRGREPKIDALLKKRGLI